MAAPNIVNVSSITGSTAVQAIGTSATAIVTNASSSNKVYKIFGKIDKNKIALISHGKIFFKCLDIYEKNKDKYVLVNLFRSKPFPEKLTKTIKDINKFLVVDEQTPSGNLASCVFEGFSGNNFFPKIISKSLPEKYVFENGGRDFLLNKNGLSNQDLLDALNNLTNQ